MDDLISRQRAIDTINALHEKPNAWLDCAVDAVIALPSAQPEIIRGEWIYGEDEYGIDGYHCDKCGFFVPWDYVHKFINYIEDYHWCPSCGADMRGEKDERID